MRRRDDPPRPFGAEKKLFLLGAKNTFTLGILALELHAGLIGTAKGKTRFFMTEPEKPSRSGRLWGFPPPEQVVAHELRGN